jgi:hypothetical protein
MAVRPPSGASHGTRASMVVAPALLAVLAAAGQVRAQALDPPAAVHVRPASSRAAALLAEGRARSATFRQLVQALERSDVFVWVETGFLGVHGRVLFAGTCQAGRLLRIRVNGLEADEHLVAWLAHELQHAVEIASAPEVDSAAALRRFYEQHGRGTPDRLCTPEAERVAARVAAELRASRKTRR